MSAATNATNLELLGTKQQLQAAIDGLQTDHTLWILDAASSAPTRAYLVDSIDSKTGCDKVKCIGSIYSAALDQERVASFCMRPHMPSQEKMDLVVATFRDLCESGSLKGLEHHETRLFLPWASTGIFCGELVFQTQRAQRTQSWKPQLAAALSDGSVQSAIERTAKSDAEKEFARFILLGIKLIVKNHTALTSAKSYRDSLASEINEIAASHSTTVPDGAQELTEQFHSALAYHCTTMLNGGVAAPGTLVGLCKAYNGGNCLPHHAVSFMVEEQHSHLHATSQLHPILANLLLLALAKLAGNDASSFSPYTIPDDDASDSSLRSASPASPASEPRKKRARLNSAHRARSAD